MLSQPSGYTPPAAAPPRRRTTWPAAWTAALLGLAWLLGARAYQTYLHLDQRAQVNSRLTSYGQAMTAALNRRFALLDGLAAFTLLHSSDPVNLPRRFAEFTPNLLASAPGLLRLELRSLPDTGPRAHPFPNGGPLVAPPASPNLPLDRQLPAEALRQARAAAAIVVGDPFLVRDLEVVPLYRVVTNTQDHAFLAILYLDAASLFAEAGLDHPPADLDLAITDEHGHYLLGSLSVFAAAPVEQLMGMPTSPWRMAAVPSGGWDAAHRAEFLIFNLGAALILLLASGLVLAASRHTRQLEDAVAARTHDLTALNARLAEDVATRVQAEAQIRRQLALLDALYASAAELTRQLDFDQRAHLIVAASVQRFGAEAAWLLRAADPADLEPLAAFPPATPALAHLAPAWNPLADPAHDRQRALLLTGQAAPWGVLVVTLPADPALVSEGFATFAHLAAIALQNAELWRATQNHAAQLEARVAERTAELEAFTYTVSHDLRAPLRAMFGFAQAIAEDYGPQLDDQARDYLRRIVQAAHRLDDLIQDLLAYARLAREQVTLQPLALERLLPAVLTQLEATLQPVGARVEVAPQLPEVRANAAILTQALVNLVSNAARFVAPGVSPQIRIWAETRPGWVRLWVADNGIGIAPEHQERIFEVFERLHGIETYPGTGIGLAIVRRAAARLGGNCGVVSQLGQGSRFWLDLEAA